MDPLIERDLDSIIAKVHDDATIVGRESMVRKVNALKMRQNLGR